MSLEDLRIQIDAIDTQIIRLLNERSDVVHEIGVIKKREGDKVIEAAKAPKLGDDVIKTRLYATPGHHRNFLDCVKSRQPTVTPVETAHRSATPGHLALISFLVNRPVKWDPVKEEIIGDAEAAKLLGREYRGSWKLEA